MQILYEKCEFCGTSVASIKIDDKILAIYEQLTGLKVTFFIQPFNQGINFCSLIFQAGCWRTL
jgi:hypothetical protein